MGHTFFEISTREGDGLWRHKQLLTHISDSEMVLDDRKRRKTAFETTNQQIQEVIPRKHYVQKFSNLNRITIFHTSTLYQRFL